MRNVKRLGAVAIALVLAVALADAVGAAEITVGQFVQQLARAKNLNAQDAADAQRALVDSGMTLPSGLNLGAVLTEDLVAKISVAAGLNVRTARPDAAFTADQADRYFAAFQRELVGTSARTGDGNSVRFDDKGRGEGESQGEGKGKGKGKGGGTPTDPF